MQGVGAAKQDESPNRDCGDVLDSAIAIGMHVVGATVGQLGSHDDQQTGQGIGEVVDRIGNDGKGV